MSSNIRMNKICEQCGNDFEARTTKTRFCTHSCNRKFYKASVKAAKIEAAKTKTNSIKKEKLIVDLKDKEFLTVADMARLLSTSKRTVYRLIEDGKIKASNVGERLTRINRADNKNLFS